MVSDKEIEEFWKDKTLDEMKFYYWEQHDNSKKIPIIEMDKCEGDIVFMIYCYNIPTKYYTRVFEDPDSNFNEEDDYKDLIFNILSKQTND